MSQERKIAVQKRKSKTLKKNCKLRKKKEEKYSISEKIQEKSQNYSCNS